MKIRLVLVVAILLAIATLPGIGKAGSTSANDTLPPSDGGSREVSAPPGLEGAIDHMLQSIGDKEHAIADLKSAIRSERAALELLEELRDEGDYGELTRTQIIAAIRKVRVAVRDENRALNQLQRSVARLHNVLRSLGWEEPVVPGAIARWTFDEGEGDIAHDSIGANHGTLVNGPTWTVGQIGGALRFDGIDDAVAIPVAEVFDFGTSDFSMTAWFKTNDTAVRPAPFVVNFRQNDNDPHIEIYVITADGRIGTHILPGGQRMEFGGSVNDGRWHHVAITLANGDSGGYVLYLDGIEKEHLTATPLLQDWDTITIGHIKPGLVQKAFAGDIDDVGVWDVALTPDQIWLLYEAGLN